MNNTQYKFLKLLYKRGATAADIQNHFPEYKTDSSLTDSSFQKLFFCRDGCFRLTPLGEEMYECRRRDGSRFCLTIVISVIALALSIYSIYLQHA